MWIAVQYLCFVPPVGEPIQHKLHADAGASNAGLTAEGVWIADDSSRSDGVLCAEAAVATGSAGSMSNPVTDPEIALFFPRI
jgi:hypothetical protein